jgi:hypothetical protein
VVCASTISFIIARNNHVFAFLDIPVPHYTDPAPTSKISKITEVVIYSEVEIKRNTSNSQRRSYPIRKIQVALKVFPVDLGSKAVAEAVRRAGLDPNK